MGQLNDSQLKAWLREHRNSGKPLTGKTDGRNVRCTATNTCPKVVEHFGSAEVWALKMTMEWVGSDAAADIPVPPNVRRYYIASSNHGGGAGGFDTSLAGAGLPAAGPTCPGNNYGLSLIHI